MKHDGGWGANHLAIVDIVILSSLQLARQLAPFLVASRGMVGSDLATAWCWVERSR